MFKRFISIKILVKWYIIQELARNSRYRSRGLRRVDSGRFLSSLTIRKYESNIIISFQCKMIRKKKIQIINLVLHFVDLLAYIYSSL
jgi:hypothetical protein